MAPQILDRFTRVPTISHSMTLYYDNNRIVANSREPRSHKKANHTKRKYYFIRDIIEQGKVTACKIASKENLTDLFMKALQAKSFKGHLVGLGMQKM